ncbi:class II lanthipeptide, LchA2/BrtA2 family [Streptomyces milbemycinicus]|uniref:class II lanthipeptide, LchA2/BrtA2 family n=1 Tax=Streptomyces milbemycinicus TaxID=476552 RepID=UPI0033EC26DA
MQKENDVLGGWDEAELVELSEADVYGGTTWVCAGVIVAGVTGAIQISSSICPTTKCTSRC